MNVLSPVNSLVHISCQALKYENEMDSLYITSTIFKELKFGRFRQCLRLHLNKMFYKPSIAQPGVLRQDNTVILAHCGLKYIDH